MAALASNIANAQFAARASRLAAKPSLSGASLARGTYSLEVTTLAASQTLASPVYASRTSPTGSGTLTLRFGTVSGAVFVADLSRAPVDITVASGATLASDDQAKLVEQQETLRSQLTQRFAVADSRIGVSQSTLTFLKNQIAAWNAPRT